MSTKSERAPDQRGHSPAVSRRLRKLAPAALLGVALALLVPAQAQAQDPHTDRAPGRLSEVDATQLDEVYLSLTVTNELSPYLHVRYEVSKRGQTLIVSLSKTLAHGYGELEDVGLVPFDDLPDILTRLVDCGLDDLDPSALPATVDTSMTFQLEVHLDGYQRRIAWPAAAAPPGSAPWCAAHVLIDTYNQFGDPVPFRNLFWNEGEYGELNTASTPAARLFVDGRDTGLVTPIYGLRLAPGTHDVRYVNAARGIDRTYDVTIVEGHTTQLELELR